MGEATQAGEAIVEAPATSKQNVSTRRIGAQHASSRECRKPTVRQLRKAEWEKYFWTHEKTFTID
jgi:hypothetical protein